MKQFLGKNFSFNFIAKNNTQTKFYKEYNCKYSKYISLNTNHLYEYGIYDSKETNADIFYKLKKYAKKWISIDSVCDWVKYFDFAVYPSFYISKEDLPYSIKNTKTKFFFGTEYVTFKKEEVSCFDQDIDNKTLVTFGGTDPNNLTEKVAGYVSKRNDKNNFIFLIGPSFKKNRNYFKEKFSQLVFIGPVSETRSLIRKSKIVISALGTTLQECEYFSKSTILISNYENDVLDVERLNACSLNPGSYNHLGYFKNINEKDFNNIYDSCSNTNYTKIYNHKSWGNGWKNILK